eukprot:CAMPEP_0114334072 /NCGR_PEP_ID=MMETSP0101-20121206/4141_1 /TAXON_ID=38822 ORGANISM="Pteridomonas danica, Strain PT" /NCGR_SAMPLE_ID=MMETSP0101 /ASSEMBLY_ACC=CAM_ASM_000211 /LENGTH=313 /DNA_ID=CAMNT_0001465229 /DNA_START=29 /DNA_END=970 /DNA_ORIENTATION=-
MFDIDSLSAPINTTSFVDMEGKPASPQKDQFNARRRVNPPGPNFYTMGEGFSMEGDGGSGNGYGRIMGGDGQWLTQYLRRLWSWEQMDFESCFDQMVTLMGPTPSTMNKVFKLAKYRKKTKNQWARDDPAFALVQVGFLLVSTAAWGVAVLGSQFTLGRFIYFFLNDLFGYWMLGGVLLSGACASIANQKLMVHSVHSVAQTVEWLYAFDIHCNGFFVSFLLTHVVQFLLLPILLKDSLISVILSASIWALGLGAYVFITHLGYRALPFLNHTEIYLYPLIAVGLGYVAIVLLAFVGYRINITRFMIGYYFGN